MFISAFIKQRTIWLKQNYRFMKVLTNASRRMLEEEEGKLEEEEEDEEGRKLMFAEPKVSRKAIK